MLPTDFLKHKQPHGLMKHISLPQKDFERELDNISCRRQPVGSSRGKAPEVILIRFTVSLAAAGACLMQNPAVQHYVRWCIEA